MRGEPPKGMDTVMDNKVQALLNGGGGNYIFPFFWQHGEDEQTLRTYMQAIAESGAGSVCVESRPHPDFCGPKWWQDMDVILGEARRRGMTVWILDDSHFPTGYANGAVKDAPLALRQQGLRHIAHEAAGGRPLRLDVEKLLARKEKTGFVEKIVFGKQGDPPGLPPDVLLSAAALRLDAEDTAVDLMPFIQGGQLNWQVPPGKWRVSLCAHSYSAGYRKNYINVLDAASCRLLIDAVYEPHYARYADDFGKTIAGFFSDEPEFGNGRMYSAGNRVGEISNLPWGSEVPPLLEEALGPDWLGQLAYLFGPLPGSTQAARVRFAYMDAITKLVQKNFSYQVGDWCRAHGVEYIGHLIEDNN